MSQLTLRYIINLAGDLQRRAAENARALEQAGQRQKKSLTAVDQAARKTSQQLEKVGTKTGAAKVEADARRMQSQLERLASSSQRTDAALGQIGLRGTASMQRMDTYMANVSRRIEGIQRGAERAANLLGKMGGAAGAITGGVIAGGAAAAASVRDPMKFDRTIANIANQVYDAATPEERLKKMADLKEIVYGAAGRGGSIAANAEAMQTYVAAGGLDIDQIKSALPATSETAASADADVVDIAKLGAAMMGNFGISRDRLGVMYSRSALAGQKGAVELKDMAGYMPGLMGEASSLGMSGEADYATLLAALETVKTTAKDPGEAANNLSNYLRGLSSQELQQSAAKQGFDLQGSLVRARAKGIDAVVASADFNRQLVEKDKQYRDYKQKADAATDAKEKEKYEKMAGIRAGATLSSYIHDAQMKSAAVSMVMHPQMLKDIRGSALADEGQTTATNMAVVKQTTGFKAQQLENQVEIARNRAFDEYKGTLGGFMDGLTQLAREFPGVATAASGAAQAMGIIAAAGAGSAIVSFLMNRGKGASSGGLSGAGGLGSLTGAPIPVYVVNKMPGWEAPISTAAGGAVGAAGALEAGAGNAGRFARIGRFLGGARGQWMINAGLAAIEFAPVLADEDRSAADKVNATGRVAAGVAGGWAGAQAGAAAGALGGPFMPVTVPLGALVGGGLGYLAATKAGDWLQEKTDEHFMPRADRVPQIQAPGGTPVDVPPGLRDRLSVLSGPSPLLDNPLLQPASALARLERMQAEPQKVEIGNGTLTVNVAVRDERVEATTRVTQQPAALRVDAGQTWPGGRH